VEHNFWDERVQAVWLLEAPMRGGELVRMQQQSKHSFAGDFVSSI
jgi:hypothetical protein